MVGASSLEVDQPRFDSDIHFIGVPLGNILELQFSIYVITITLVLANWVILYLVM